ncbi:MAG: RAMP superfamily protein [Firmicutes bacterium ADurb.Bin419]|nr:MAG: RAMP superfamily protein [Firmicutes bacterium ADurb.Bin419]
MSGRFKKYVIEIETKGPLHVGNGEKHSPYEFVYQPESKKLGMLNEGKWLKYLKDNRLYEKYEKDALKNNFKVFTWMDENSIDPWSIDVYRYIIEGVEQDKDKALNDVSCLVKNYCGEPYLPGSGIKGMFRTALLSYKILKERKNYIEYWNMLEKSNTREMNKCIRNVEGKCLDVLPKKDENKNLQSQLLDVFRAILVSDSCTVSAGNITVVQKTDWGQKTVNSGKTLPLWREALKKNTLLSFAVTMDINMLKSSRIGITGIEDLLEILDYYYENILLKFDSNFRIQGIDEFYSSKEKPLVYLGGGTGFHTKSILYSLAPDSNSARKVISRLLDERFNEKHNHVVNDTKVSPRTIKFAKTQQGLSRMGLCSMKVVDEIACDD